VQVPQDGRGRKTLADGRKRKGVSWQPTTHLEFGEVMMKRAYGRGQQGEALVYTLFDNLRVRITYSAPEKRFTVHDDKTDGFILSGRRGDIVDWYVKLAHAVENAE
jgi:hypothetical protein